MDEERLRILIEARDRATATLKSLGDGLSSIDGIVRAVGVGFIALEGAALTVGAGLYKAMSAAAQEADQVERLRAVVERAGGSWDTYAGLVDAAIEQTVASTEFGDDAVRAALTRIIGTSGDTAHAIEGMNAAIGMTRVTGQDLDATSRLVGLALAGNVDVLGRYVPAIKDAVKALGEQASTADKAALAQRFLSDNFAMLATAIDPTTQALAEVKNRAGNFVEAVGALGNETSIFNVVLKSLSSTLVQAGAAMEKNKGVVRSLIKDGVLLAIDAFRLFATATEWAGKAAVGFGTVATAAFGAITKGASYVMAGWTSMVVGLERALSGAANVLARFNIATGSREAAQFWADLGASVDDASVRLELWRDKTFASMQGTGDAAFEMAERFGSGIATIDSMFEAIDAGAARVRDAVSGIDVSQIVSVHREATKAAPAFDRAADAVKRVADELPKLVVPGETLRAWEQLADQMRRGVGTADSFTLAVLDLGVADEQFIRQTQRIATMQQAAAAAFDAGTLSGDAYLRVMEALDAELQRLGVTAPDTAEKLKQVVKATIDIGPMIAESIQGASAALGTLFADIGGGASSPLKAFTANLLEVIGQFMTTFGAALVTLGVGKVALDAFSGPAMIVAGGVLVAAGAALSGAARNMSSGLGQGRGGETGISAAQARASGPAFGGPSGGGGGGRNITINVNTGGGLITSDDVARGVRDGLARSYAMQEA